MQSLLPTKALGNLAVNFSGTRDAILVEKEFRSSLKGVLARTEWKKCLVKLEDTILSSANAVDFVASFI